MTPAVTLASKPNGLPIAIAISPGFSFFEIAELRRGKRRVFIDPDEGKVGVGIIAKDTAGEAAAVENRDIRALGALHDMAVGKNQTVRREDDAGARPAAAALTDIEPHDAWPDPLDDLGHRLRISVKKRRVAARRIGKAMIFGPIICAGWGRCVNAAPRFLVQAKGEIVRSRNILVHAQIYGAVHWLC